MQVTPASWARWVSRDCSISDNWTLNGPQIRGGSRHKPLVSMM
jgi:hypothetical protein